MPSKKSEKKQEKATVDVTKVVVTNLTKSGIMVNSLKVFLPPEGSIVRNVADADDADLQSLVGLKMVAVAPLKAAAKPKPAAKPVAPSPKMAPDEVDDDDAKDKRKVDSKLTSPQDQMGRDVTMIDRGEVRTGKMNPGKHNTSAPKFLDTDKADKGEEGEEGEEKDGAFIEI